MAKQFLLIRHGKSEREDHDLKNFDRPLNHKGNKNSIAMAERFLNKHLPVPFLVSSPALRAISTAKHFARVFDIQEDKIHTDKAIYEANTMALLQVVNNLPNKHDIVAMFGHNPGFTDFANYLADAHIYNIPTSGVVIINFDVDDWKEISRHTGTMLSFDFPNNTEEPH